MSRPRLWVPVLAFACVVCAAGSPAGQRDTTAWGTVVVPGGAGGIRQAAYLGSDRPVVNLLADLARRHNSTPVGSRVDPTGDLVRYVDYLAGLRAYLDRLPDGLSLAMARHADRQVRNAFRDAVEFMGLRVETRNDVASIVAGTGDESAERSRWLQGVGIATGDVATRLQNGDTLALAWTDDVVPLPLPDLWTRFVFERNRAPVRSLVGRPQAARFYLGLVSLDEATRAWLAGQPDLFRRLHDDHALAFSVFGRSVRVAGGRVDVPGGAAAEPIWEDLVDARVTQPEAFVRRLLERDAGRFAYFYDLAAHLDPARRDFLLGAHVAGATAARDRLRFVRRVFDRVKDFDSTWDASKLPFFKPAIDPALVLATIDVTPAGGIGPRWWPALLEHVASDRSWPDRVRPRRLRPQAGDAEWLLRWVFESTPDATTRFQMLRFLQRRFADAPETAAPQIEIALRARADMPALALALERMGIARPETYASVALASRRLTHAGDPADVSTAMRVWQASIALLEQVARHRRLAPDVADDLLASLVTIEPPRPARPGGVVAGWLLDVALPRLGLAAPAGGEPLDAAAITAILREGAPGDVSVQWEGLPYRLDPVGPAIQAAIRIRQATPGPRLDHLATLLRVSRRLAAPAESIESVKSIEALRPVVADLGAVLPALEHVRDHDGEARALDRLRDVVRNLERITRPRDLNRAAREVRNILEVVDATAGDVVPALAYALALVPTANPPQLYSDAHRFHDYGVGSLQVDFRTRVWEVPAVEPREGGGTRVTGAMLGVDVARAAEQLRRIVTAAPRRPSMTEPDRIASVQRVVLRAGDPDLARGGDIAAAIARGRALVAGWQAAPRPVAEVEAALRDARLSQWRVSMAVALVATGRLADLDGFFTMTDYYRLGSVDDPPAAWGQSGWFIEGCWCLRRLDRRPPEDWLGRTLGLSASVTADLPLRVTELLAELGLPHQLLEPILPIAIQDLLDQADQATNDDWESLAWPRRLTLERVEAYLLDLVKEGLLAAPR